MSRGNAEVDSMDGIVDCGVGLGTNTSPRRAAIEKALAKLRQEYDVRGERKRELEFLEKGGNPLDFNFGHAASNSLQSTSFTDRPAERYVISEAKGSFALAASPHGDSIESSGRPGGSVDRETNIADNLLLFDGENSNPSGEKSVKRTCKRGNSSLHVQSSGGDGYSHAKGTEGSLIFHLGVKNQAYARRNRSRTSRDSHGNKSTVPSTFPDHRDGNISVQEARAENNGSSYVSNSKTASPNGHVTSKAPFTDNKLDMELDGVQTHHTNAAKINGGVREGEAEVNLSETMQNINQPNQQTNLPGGQVAKDEVTSVDIHLVSPGTTGNVTDATSVERVDSIPAKDATDVRNDDLSRSNCDIVSVSDVRNLSDVKGDTCAEKENGASGNADSENFGVVRSEESRPNVESKGNSVLQKSRDNKGVKENGLSDGVEGLITSTDQQPSVSLNLTNLIIRVKDEVESCDNKTDIVSKHENLRTNGEIVSKPERKLADFLGDNSHSINKAGVITSSLVGPTCEPLSTALSKRGNSTTSAVQNSEANHIRLAKKAHEDAILKEARIIEANLKRTAQLSTTYKSLEWGKFHWDFVLEEMAWMANDFMQERLWKTAAAARVGHHIASTGRSNFEQAIIHRKQRNVARTLAKAVMHFWHAADVFRTTGEAPKDINGECNSDLLKSYKVNEADGKDQGSKYIEAEKIGMRPAIHGYAVRFLQYDCSASPHSVLDEAPTTPDRVNDIGISKRSWDDEFSGDSLFYTIPPGAMQLYREAVESQWLNSKKTVNTANQEDCEASPCDSFPDGPRKNQYEEEEGESGSYFFPGAFEGTISSKFTHKKKKNFQQKYIARSYNVGNDFSYESRPDGKSANRVLMFTGKRPSSNPNVGPIPTKRVRTASRQRVVGPFGAGPTGSLQITNKTDVSSGDTNSLQDDQSSMHGGSQSRKNMEVESTADFEKQFAFDGSETSAKSKKKKSKLPGYSNFSDSGVQVASEKGSMFDQRLQADSMVPQDQRDKVRKRLESQHYESNGHMGIYGQHAGKKPKLVKQLIDPSQEAIIPATGSTLSPVASQMSNMSNQNKFIKIIANRDRGRKSKAMKIAAGQSSSGISWTTFEDQALIVFVHDMGPNWELVSDAINNTLQFKRIFRKPKECKERHKALMEKSAGDGADSAEDSGSSQPYPSTLPGIPKGSAGLLFQRLQGPMEEDTLKDHFEKIISIGQKLHFCRSQKDSQELKQITPVHNSHYVALSQMCPNNLGGGFLTPFDLCDSISSSPDVLAVGYQGPHTSGAAISSQQGSPSPVLSTSTANTMLQGPSGIVLGSNIPSPSIPMNAPARDAQRYCIPRAASLPVDDQQKMQYAQMLSGRNIQQASMSVNGALAVGVDRGTHMLPNGNGMGMMGGRATPMPRPGFQGIMSPGMPMVSTGGLLVNGGVGVPNPVNVNPGAVPGPGNSMLRLRDALQMPRPGQNTEDHRQMMMMQDLQMQVSQGNSQTLPPFTAMSAPFSTTTGLPSVPAYPPQSHQMLGNPHHPHIQGMNHSNPQQAYAMRLGKERQLQQRMLPQSQQPLYSSSSSLPPVQSNSQLKPQTQPSSAPPTSSQPQHNKQQQMPHNPQSSSGMPNQIMKQRQRQQAHQHQQKQLLQQQQQQPKLVKGLSGGPMLMHQNLTVDPSQVSSTPAAPRNQGFFPGSSSLNSTLPHPSNQHKLYARPPPQTSKQMLPLPSHSDSVPSSIPLAASSPPLQQQRPINQNMQRMVLQQNRKLSTDGRAQISGDPQVQANQMIPGTSLPRCTDSSNSAPLVSSALKEPSYDTSSATPKTHLDSLPAGNMVRNDTLVSSGSVSVDGHGVGRQWHPQQQSQLQMQLQLQQQQQQSQQQHRQGVQGNLYMPSNSGPG